jgi:hypothetical protein
MVSNGDSSSVIFVHIYFKLVGVQTAVNSKISKLLSEQFEWNLNINFMLFYCPTRLITVRGLPLIRIGQCNSRV